MNRFTVSANGLILAIGSVLLYAAGWLLGYDVLVQLAVGGLALLVLGLLAVLVRPRVTLSRVVTPDRLTVGDEAVGTITVANPSRWPAFAFTAVDRVGERTVDLPISALAPKATRSVSYPIPAYRRGRLRLGPLTVARRDPLGLFGWARRQVADGELWVHPRVHPLPPLPVGVVLDYEGRSTDNARLGTVTFAALREYVPGDDPRRIHWKSTARLGTLVVREHVDTTEPTTTVVLDTRFGEAESFEHAVEIAASVARAVEALGRPAALHIVAEPADTGAVSTLDRLALAERSTVDTAELLGTLNRASAGGALVIVTGGPEPGLLGRLAEQRRRFTPVVVASITPDAPGATTRRRPGLAVLTGRTAREMASAWQRLVRGEVGEG